MSLFGIDISEYSASILLQHAILFFPETIRPLVMSCNDKELNKLCWREVINDLDTFYTNETSMPFMLKIITNFVTRSASIWNNTQILDWMCKNVQWVIQKYKNDENIFNKFNEIRKETYNHPIPNHIAKLTKYHYSDETPQIPLELLQMQRQLQGQLPFQHLGANLNPGGAGQFPMNIADPRTLQALLAALQDRNA